MLVPLAYKNLLRKLEADEVTLLQRTLLDEEEESLCLISVCVQRAHSDPKTRLKSKNKH